MCNFDSFCQWTWKTLKIFAVFQIEIILILVHREQAFFFLKKTYLIIYLLLLKHNAIDSDTQQQLLSKSISQNWLDTFEFIFAEENESLVNNCNPTFFS